MKSKELYLVFSISKMCYYVRRQGNKANIAKVYHKGSDKGYYIKIYNSLYMLDVYMLLHSCKDLGHIFSTDIGATYINSFRDSEAVAVASDGQTSMTTDTSII